MEAHFTGFAKRNIFYYFHKKVKIISTLTSSATRVAQEK